MTTDREALIEKLVVSLHLSVSERHLLGSDSVSIEELSRAVKRVFGKHDLFPPHARLWQSGQSVFDGFVLIRQPDGKLSWQRSNPGNPAELADRGSIVFDNPDEAIVSFIDRQWRRSIDTIHVTP